MYILFVKNQRYDNGIPRVGGSKNSGRILLLCARYGDTLTCCIILQKKEIMDTLDPS